MLPGTFIQKWILGLTLLILIVAGSSYFLSKQFSPGNKPVANSIPEKRNFPTEFASQLNPGNSNIRILYQDPNDKEGRTVIYSSGQKFAANGVGLKSLRNGYPYIVGLFVRWEELAGSENRLLDLRDPIGNTTIASMQVMFSLPTPNPNELQITKLSVENLSRVKSGDANTASSVEEEPFVDISQISDEKLSDLIHPGDALLIVPQAVYDKYDTKKWTLVDGGNAQLFAAQIILRRWNGARDVQL